MKQYIALCAVFVSVPTLHSMEQARPLITPRGALIIGASLVGTAGLAYAYVRQKNTQLTRACTAFSDAALLTEKLEKRYGGMPTDPAEFIAAFKGQPVDAFKQQLTRDTTDLAAVSAKLGTAESCLTNPAHTVLKSDTRAVLDRMTHQKNFLDRMQATLEYCYAYSDLQYSLQSLDAAYIHEISILNSVHHTPEYKRATIHTAVILRANKQDARNFFPYSDYGDALEQSLLMLRHKLHAFMRSAQYQTHHETREIATHAQALLTELQKVYAYIIACPEYAQDRAQKGRAREHIEREALERQKLEIAQKELAEKKRRNELEARMRLRSQRIMSLCNDGKRRLDEFPAAARVLPGFGETKERLYDLLNQIQQATV